MLSTRALIYVLHLAPGKDLQGHWGPTLGEALLWGLPMRGAEQDKHTSCPHWAQLLDLKTDS